MRLLRVKASFVPVRGLCPRRCSVLLLRVRDDLYAGRCKHALVYWTDNHLSEGEVEFLCRQSLPTEEPANAVKF